MVIYNLLGKDAQNSFSFQWLVNYVMDNTQQWKDIFQTAVKAAIILYILDRLRFISDMSWFESHIDTLSIMATLAQDHAVGWMDRTIAFVRFTSRVGG